MTNKKTRKVFDNDFRNDAVRYAKEHEELSVKEAAKNLGVGKSTLQKWIHDSKLAEDGVLEMRGTGNYESEEAKEIARLKRDFHPVKPNTIRCMDITYIWTNDD